MIGREIQGKYVSLRPVDVGDAGFVCDIRSDSDLCRYVHAVSPDVEAQADWIREQRSREGDYYFVVCGKGGVPVGLASVYNVDAARGSAEFGRWVSRGNALQNVETAILLFDYAFSELGCRTVYTRTMVENLAVRGFWSRFGSSAICEVIDDGLALDLSVVDSRVYKDVLRARNARLLRY